MTVPDGWTYGADGWRLLTIAEYDRTLDASAADYDDSSWSEVTAPVGGGPASSFGPHPLHPGPVTEIPKDTTNWMRRRVDDGGETELIVDGQIDVWFDGTLILSDYTEPHTWPGGRKIISITVPYSGVIAVRFDDDLLDGSGDYIYFDMAVPIEPPMVRQYPRDDAYGFGSAPRQYPPPRVDRVVGGFQ